MGCCYRGYSGFVHIIEDTEPNIVALPLRGHHRGHDSTAIGRTFARRRLGFQPPVGGNEPVVQQAEIVLCLK